ncbi:hypothetical protein A9Q84_15735 [Halobacteriovorax marinus]|uniref:HD-GYP domain-containing protein n=1 Tax=Halobacteriovorax marinus TaxID=97084 RepID=A0A1Y5F9R1_9BACT|nr:hypothetical protein A9Q84_15735 [Halobacteriovorax marinus]
MNKIIVCSSSTEFVEYVSLLIEGKFPVSLEIKTTSDEFISNPKMASDIFMIITDFKLDESDGELIRNVNHKRYQIPLLYVIDSDDHHDKTFFDKFFFENKYNRALTKISLTKKLVPLIQDLVHQQELDGIFKESLEEHDGKKLYRIRASLFLERETVSGDVFVKLQNGKFIKVIKANDEVNRETVQNIINKKQYYLYQDAASYEEFLGQKLSVLKKVLNIKDITQSKKVQLQLKSIKEVQDAVRVMGISDLAIELTEEIVDSVDEMITNNKSLKPLVKKMLEHKSTFFTRSSLLNYLLGGLASKIGWNTKSSLKKLIFSSVFCDFAFTNDQDHLANILTFNDPDVEGLSKLEKKMLEKHPEMAATKLENNSQGIMLDESNIIKQHHEKPDGSGFPKGLNNKTIPPMSCAFILCYDFVQHLILSCEKPEDFNCEAVFKELGETYRTGNFEKPYFALRKALQLDY